MTIHSGRPTPNPDLNTWPLPEGLRARLMREHGWSAAFAEQAETEYRRFVYLATLGRAVTPSPAVDEVWHTHLMFTRDYWGGFQALLPAPLHHEPGTDAPGDAARLREQYLDTLALYERTFGEAAPATCWPRPAIPATNPAQRPAPGGLWGWVVGAAVLGLGGSVLTGTPLFLLPTALVFGILALAVLLGRRGGHSGPGDGAAGAGGLVLFGLDLGGDGGSTDSGGCGSSDGGGAGCGSGCGGGGCGS